MFLNRIVLLREVTASVRLVVSNSFEIELNSIAKQKLGDRYARFMLLSIEFAY